MKCFRRSAAMLIGLLLGGLAQAASPVARFVGVEQFQVPYYQTSIDATLWYPTTSPARQIDAFSVVFMAAPDAPMAAGRFPLVLISHGTGGMKLNHYPIARALVKAGFIVATLTHPGDNFRDRSLLADPRYFYERPRQISRVLDHILANQAWAGSVDNDRIAALGHSAGGYAVAALIGARPDLDRLRNHCDSVTDDPACSYRNPELGIVNASNSSLALPDTVKASGPLNDTRIKAAILLAPMGAVVRAGSLKSVTVPVRLIGAEHDEILARPYHFDWLNEQLGIEPTESQLTPQLGQETRSSNLAKGVGHFSFLAPFKPAFIEATRTELGGVVVPRAGVDRAAFQQTLTAQLIIWLNQVLAK